MGIFVLGGLLLIPVIWGILHWGGAFTRENKRSRHEVGEGEGTAVIVGSIATAIFFVVTFGMTIANHADLAKREAFYEANTSNYEITVDRMESHLSEQQFIENALIPIEGSIEKFEQTKYVNDRLREWRDATNEYNRVIKQMKYFDSTPMFGAMYPDEVQDMKLIIIE